jgi:hypothetical protein
MALMDHGEVGGYWDRNAESWIELSRAGYDLYRDLVNTPSWPWAGSMRGVALGSCGRAAAGLTVRRPLG